MSSSSGSIRRARAFQNYHNKDSAHPEAPGNAEIGYQPTRCIPDYAAPDYDTEVDGPPPFVHSPAYDWLSCFIVLAAEGRIKTSSISGRTHSARTRRTSDSCEALRTRTACCNTCSRYSLPATHAHLSHLSGRPVPLSTRPMCILSRSKRFLQCLPAIRLCSSHADLAPLSVTITGRRPAKAPATDTTWASFKTPRDTMMSAQMAPFAPLAAEQLAATVREGKRTKETSRLMGDCPTKTSTQRLALFARCTLTTLRNGS